MKKILLAYHESDTASHALERAAELAKAFDSELIVTSIAPVMTGIGGGSGPIDPVDPPSEQAGELNNARTYLERQGLEAEYLPGVGHPADTIAQLAAERGVDLIVLGTHEPSLLARLFGQSVTESVAHKAHCDVLIVH